ncbi:hypothetical protein, partial [Photobacterium proteolyticum]|uniref:hypothetical protein n=1 Tax=Photobacterium proteolyticum TaxID=1903952 RepID=UPI000A690998
ESVIGLNRNERSDNPGIRGRNTPEYAISPNILIEQMPEHLKSEQDVVLNEAIQKLNGMLNTPS